MSIQWADDFSRYGTGTTSRTAMLEGLVYGIIKGSAIIGIVTDDPDPNETGRAFLLGIADNDWFDDFRIALPTVVSGTVGVAFRAWIDALPSEGSERPALVGVKDISNDYIAYMRIEANGSITVNAIVAGVFTEVANSINPIVSPSSFNHFEFVHANDTGAGSLYINGIERLTWIGVDVNSSALVNFSSRSGSGIAERVYIKDLVIWDSFGSQNNSVMGTVIVRRLKPNADNTLGGWVPSVGTTGFDLLAKDAPDDSSYLSADDTPPAPMAFDLEDLPPDVTSVRALISVVRVRKVDGGDATVQNGLSPDGITWDDGADRPITTAFTYYFDVSELDPTSATPWSPAAVDDALIRIDRTT